MNDINLNDSKNKNVHKKTHWEIVVIVVLLCLSILFAFFGSSDTLKRTIKDSTKTTLNVKQVQRVNTSLVAPGNQFSSELYIIPIKVEGTERTTIDGVTKNYLYISFPPSMLPNNSILCYFNSIPNTSSYLRWLNDSGIGKLQLVLGGSVVKSNTYRFSNNGTTYRWYLTDIQFNAILTPYISNYNGDVETPYYNALWSLLSDNPEPYILDSSLIYESFFDWVEYFDADYQSASFVCTWDYYQIQIESEAYQQGYDIGYNTGNSDGLSEGKKEGISEGQNDVLNNPSSFGLYTPSQYEKYGNDKFNEGKSSVPASADKEGFQWLMGSILNAPYNIFSGILNFEIFGINLFSLASFIITAMLIMFIIKLIISR